MIIILVDLASCHDEIISASFILIMAAKYYNCSDKYLWRNGMAHVMLWVYIGISILLIVNIFHRSIIEIGNSKLTLAWILLTGILLLIWYKFTGKVFENFHSYILGYFGEFFVRRELKKLPDGDVIFYDVRIPGLLGNIDYIVVCPYGVFVVEVKARLDYILTIFSIDGEDMIRQVRNQVAMLQVIFNKYGLNIKIIPTIVFSHQPDFNQNGNTEIKIMGKKDVVPFFSNPNVIPKVIISENDFVNIRKIVFTYNKCN